MSRAWPTALRPGADETGRAQGPVLIALGERVRALRARRGMTRKALAQATDVSERHLANLEYGVGNASILVLLQVTRALHCSFAELLGDVTTQSPEWLLLREMLREPRRGDAAPRANRGRRTARNRGRAGAKRARSSRVALIGLRGAGKSTLGRMLAEDLDFPVRRAHPRDRENGRLQRRPKSSASTARTPTAATSAARSRRRCRSIRRR